MVKTFGQKKDFIKEHFFSTPSLAMRAYQDLTHRAPPPLIREKGQTIAILHTRTDLQQRFFTIKFFSLMGRKVKSMNLFKFTTQIQIKLFSSF